MSRPPTLLPSATANPSEASAPAITREPSLPTTQLGADRPAWATGYGRLADHPHAQRERLVRAPRHRHMARVFRAARLGEVLRVVPNHVCAAVNLADELVVMAGGTMVDRWRVAARGADN